MIKRQYGLILLAFSLCDLLVTLLLARDPANYIVPVIGGIVGILVFSRGVSKRILSQYVTRRVFWSEEDECYIATLPEFPYLSGLGDTEAEALRELDIALESSIRIYEDEGWPLPKSGNGNS